MKIPIQVAIDALTRYTPTKEIRYDRDDSTYEVAACHEDSYGKYFYRQDVLAALQAEPAPGSIDTPDERVAFEAWHDAKFRWMSTRCSILDFNYADQRTQERWETWQARAQRAADSDWLIKTQRAALDSLYETNAELTNQLVQRATSADDEREGIACWLEAEGHHVLASQVFAGMTRPINEARRGGAIDRWIATQRPACPLAPKASIVKPAPEYEPSLVFGPWAKVTAHPRIDGDKVVITLVSVEPNPLDQQLKPCPFCGDAESLQIRHLEGTVLHPAHEVHCDNCGATGPWSDKGDYVKEWNTRNNPK